MFEVNLNSVRTVAASKLSCIYSTQCLYVWMYGYCGFKHGHYRFSKLYIILSLLGVSVYLLSVCLSIKSIITRHNRFAIKPDTIDWLTFYDLYTYVSTYYIFTYILINMFATRACCATLCRLMCLYVCVCMLFAQIIW